MNINDILKKIDADEKLSIKEIVFLLNLQKPDALILYQKADSIRQKHMGDEIFLRGIIEFSNYCRKDCFYCGIGRSNSTQERYRIPEEEILTTCKQIEAAEQTTVVLQSGEDIQYTKEILGNLITKIKSKTTLAITLSVGERDEETYRYWKDKGLDRYLLRFETSDKELFKRCHPDDDLTTRINCLKAIKKVGIQTGSGFLIGLPEETPEQLALDIQFCTDLDLDMIGVGPFIPHEKTEFSTTSNPFDKETYFKVISIVRLLNKKSHIPATTAFDTIDPNGRNLLLQRGANVFMPNATPKKYRDKYLLYPGKPCVDESASDCAGCVKGRVAALGRSIGKGPGHSIK